MMLKTPTKDIKLLALNVTLIGS